MNSNSIEEERNAKGNLRIHTSPAVLRMQKYCISLTEQLFLSPGSLNFMLAACMLTGYSKVGNSPERNISNEEGSKETD